MILVCQALNLLLADGKSAPLSSLTAAQATGNRRRMVARKYMLVLCQYGGRDSRMGWTGEFVSDSETCELENYGRLVPNDYQLSDASDHNPSQPVASVALATGWLASTIQSP